MTTLEKIEEISSNKFSLFDNYGVKRKDSDGNEYELLLDKRLNPFKTGILATLVFTPFFLYSSISVDSKINSNDRNNYIETQKSVKLINKPSKIDEKIIEIKKKLKNENLENKVITTNTNNKTKNKLIDNYNSLGYKNIVFNLDYNNDGQVEEIPCFYKKEGRKLKEMFCYNQKYEELLSKKDLKNLEEKLSIPFNLYKHKPSKLKVFMDRYDNKAKDDLISSSLDYASLENNFDSVPKLMKTYNGMKKVLNMK